MGISKATWPWIATSWSRNGNVNDLLTRISRSGNVNRSGSGNVSDWSRSGSRISRSRINKVSRRLGIRSRSRIGIRSRLGIRSRIGRRRSRIRRRRRWRSRSGIRISTNPTPR